MVRLAGYEITTNDDPFRGLSLSIYCAGCTRSCVGCHNSDLQDFNAGKEVSSKYILELIKHRSNLIKSVVFVGGDWINYPVDLVHISKTCLEINLRTVLYTGATLDSLCSEIIENIDVIIDGEYRYDLPSGVVIPSSSNQKVYVQITPGKFVSVHYMSLPINQEIPICLVSE